MATTTAVIYHHETQQHRPAGMLMLLRRIHLAASTLLCLCLLPHYSPAGAAAHAILINHTIAAMPPPPPPAASSLLPCLPDQASALLRLKRSFAATKASATAFRSWRAGTDCCNWDGVRCSDGGGGDDDDDGTSSGGRRVVSLDLGGWGLRSAALDPAVFALTSLRHLNLAHNDFGASELPSTGFERLTELTRLNLSTANFSGAIPAGSIGCLTKLVALDLSVAFRFRDLADYGYEFDADLTDPLVLPDLETMVANLGSLRELRLDCADLSANGAQWCTTLAKYAPDLSVLSLPICSLSGPICGSFSRLRSLAVLDLRYNSISGPVPDFFANFSSLRVLQISRNILLQGWFPSRIFRQANLETVDLSHSNGISGSLPNFSADSRLENLLLGDTRFSGKIPSSISNLKSLKKLDLGATGFYGEIPYSIGKLRSLDLLAFSGYGLVGDIPSWIVDLTFLTVLRISKCGLAGSIPSFVSTLRNLTELTLSNCKFDGNIPSSISNLSQLETVNLESNHFIGTVDLSLFWRLPNLFMLSLSNNNLVVVDREEDNSSLVYPGVSLLGLASCSIEIFPKVLRHLDQIYGLDLSCNQIHGVVPGWVWDNWYGSELYFLNLSHNKLTNIGFDIFLPSYIDVFDLSFNMFEGPMPIPQNSGMMLVYSNNMFTSIPLNISLDNTFVFMASRNNLSGSILSSFCSPSLEILDLSYNNFSGPLLSCIMEDNNELQVLNLKNNQLHGELPHKINESCSLELLDIGDNWIRGQLPRSLVACKNLEVLDTQNNQISDSFPCWISTLAWLQVLVLKSNKFFGQVGPSVEVNKTYCEFPSLRILDLSSNNFSGTLAEEWFMKMTSMMVKEENETLVMEYDGIGRQVYQFEIILTYKGADLMFEKILRTLMFFDVSSNAFQGSIPMTIGELVLLSMLNMSHNSFTGPIPSQLSNLIQLESMDLSSNEISGEIPQMLATMNFLTTLNLSDNKLVGRIPESPHFETFSNNSFLGNDGLCGSPLSKECNNITTPAILSHHSKKKSIDIVLFLFVGLGFGVGFAISVVMAWKIPIRKWF